MSVIEYEQIPISGEAAVIARSEPEVLFSAGGRLAMLEDISQDIESGIPMIVISGEKGAGKSAFCRMLVQNAPTGCIVILFRETVESFEDVVSTVARELEHGEVDVSRSAMAATIDSLGVRLTALDKRLVLILDGAEMIYLATLERIRRMLDQLNAAGVRMQVVLSGRPLLQENLKQLGIVQFQEVPEKHYLLTPLDLLDTSTFIDYLTDHLGATAGGLFSPGAIEQIHAATGGNIGAIWDCVEYVLQSDDRAAALDEILKSVAGKNTKGSIFGQLAGGLKTFSRKQLVVAGSAVAALLLLFLLFSGDKEESGQPVVTPESVADQSQAAPVAPEATETPVQPPVAEEHLEEPSIPPQPVEEGQEEQVELLATGEPEEEMFEVEPEEVQSSPLVETAPQPSSLTAEQPLTEVVEVEPEVAVEVALPEVEPEVAVEVALPEVEPEVAVEAALPEVEPEVEPAPVVPSATDEPEVVVVEMAEPVQPPEQEQEDQRGDVEIEDASKEMVAADAELPLADQGEEPAVEVVPTAVAEEVTVVPEQVAAAEEALAETAEEIPFFKRDKEKVLIPVEASTAAEVEEADTSIVISSLAETEKREVITITSGDYKRMLPVEEQAVPASPAPPVMAPAIVEPVAESPTPAAVQPAPSQTVPVAKVEDVPVRQPSLVPEVKPVPMVPEQKIAKPMVDVAVVPKNATESPSVVSGSVILAERLAAGKAWLDGKRDDRYTMQLMMLTSQYSEEKIKNILSRREYAQASDNFYVFKKDSSPPAYFVFYGEYKDMAAAKNARNSIPVFLRNHRPYVLSVPGALSKVRE